MLHMFYVKNRKITLIDCNQLYKYIKYFQLCTIVHNEMFVFSVNLTMHESLDKIERYIISKVREIREAKGVTQEQLSLSIGKNITFISQIEAPSKKAKYNVVHLNEIAKVLNCSPKDFWPDRSL
jgi:hypothetical protein